MKKIPLYFYILMIMMLALLSSQSQATCLRFKTLDFTIHSMRFLADTDSCFQQTYKYDDSIIADGFSCPTGYTFQLGNYFPISTTATGVIKSLDMAFDSNSFTSGQSCIVYFYKPDQTTIFGQSSSFINTGALYPSYSWVNVPCPDIPYSGPFYAMVDYTSTGTTNKNFFVLSANSVPGFPMGVGYCNQDGVWNYAVVVYGGWPGTFFQRVNVCGNGTVGIKELSTESISVYPNPANDVVNVVLTDNIKSVELLNYLGQTVYKSTTVNMKFTKLDVSGFNSGAYFVKITTMNGFSTARITIIH